MKLERILSYGLVVALLAACLYLVITGHPWFALAFFMAAGCVANPLAREQEP